MAILSDQSMVCSVLSIDCINNGRRSCDITHSFVDYHFEALSFDFSCRHLAFLETEVTIFGKKGDAEDESRDAK